MTTANAPDLETILNKTSNLPNKEITPKLIKKSVVF